ncbi:MAG TPA: redox-sensing transcriptional repressor Rex [Chitinispirillaceae bacterium]|nr:redox-sensing transcriptional repressor Rex [Chitinispirillaceae bacterium]
MNSISTPAISRLCALYQLLGQFEQQSCVSSTELGERLGVGAHSIRKDINFLGIAGNSGAGYDVSKLRALIEGSLGLGAPRRVCVVGLGRLGTAILQYPLGDEFQLVAGFDSNINRLETIKTTTELFPAYQISQVVRSLNIDIAFIAVPADHVQDVAERLVDGGIKGIVNFATVCIRTKKKDVFVKQMDIAGELRIISAQISVSTAL